MDSNMFYPEGQSFVLHRGSPCVVPTDNAWDLGSRRRDFLLTSVATGFGNVKDELLWQGVGDKPDVK